VVMGKQDIYLSVATPEHAEELTILLTETFSEEPSTKGCEIGEPLTFEEWETFVKFFIRECCTNNISAVAIDRETNVRHVDVPIYFHHADQMINSESQEHLFAEIFTWHSHQNLINSWLEPQDLNKF
jgi:hypothetical protein